MPTAMSTSSKPRLVKPTTGSVESSITLKAIPFRGSAGSIYLDGPAVHIHERPDYGDWEAAMLFAMHAEEHSPKWVAQLLEYASTRPDWGDIIDAVLDSGRFKSLKVIDEYRRVARAFKNGWVEGASFGHHQKVASQSTYEDRVEYLKRAKTEGLTASQLGQVVQKEKKVKRVLQGQASDLAKAHDAVAEAAYEAASLCREIPLHDCANAERIVKKVRTQLDRVDTAIERYRKAQGKS